MRSSSAKPRSKCEIESRFDERRVACCPCLEPVANCFIGKCGLGEMASDDFGLGVRHLGELLDDDVSNLPVVIPPGRLQQTSGKQRPAAERA